MNITGRSGTAAVGIGKEEYSKHSNSSSVVVATVVVVAKTIMMTAVFFIAQAVCVTCRFRGAGRGVAFGYFSLVHCCCPVLLVAVAAYTIIMAAKDASGTMWGVFQLFFIVLCLIPICYFSIHSFTFFCFCHSFLPALSSFVICLLFLSSVCMSFFSCFCSLVCQICLHRYIRPFNLYYLFVVFSICFISFDMPMCTPSL